MVQMLVETPLGQFRELCLVVSLDGAQLGIVSLDQDGLRSNKQRYIFQICPCKCDEHEIETYPLYCIETHFLRKFYQLMKSSRCNLNSVRHPATFFILVLSYNNALIKLKVASTRVAKCKFLHITKIECFPQTF